MSLTLTKAEERLLESATTAAMDRYAADREAVSDGVRDLEGLGNEAYLRVGEHADVEVVVRRADVMVTLWVAFTRDDVEPVAVRVAERMARAVVPQLRLG